MEDNQERDPNKSKFNPNAARCTAKAQWKIRAGLEDVRCDNPARKGYTVCFKHGAGTKARPGGRPIVTGRYSEKLPRGLLNEYEKLRDDPQLLELRDNIAICHIRIQDLINVYSEARIKAEETGKPLYSILQPGWDKQFLLYNEQLRKLVGEERNRILALTQVLGADRIAALVSFLIDVIKTHVKEPTTLTAIIDEIRLLGTPVSYEKQETHGRSFEALPIRENVGVKR